MKVFTAGLVNKPLTLLNEDLRKKLESDLAKLLQVKPKNILSQELNTFILVSAQKNLVNEKKSLVVDDFLFDKVETGKLNSRYEKYYKQDERRFRTYLRKNQEAKEISQIVENFVSEIDKETANSFENQLKDINSFIPQVFHNLSRQNFITLWEIEEHDQYRFHLSAFEHHIFSGRLADISVPIENLLDKLLIINFLETFLTPTQARLKKMDEVLDQLRISISEQQYRVENKKLQNKFEMFIRLLTAKLGSLQEMDNVLARIYRLFEQIKGELSQQNLQGNIQDFNSILSRMQSQIDRSLTLQVEVANKIQNCQHSLRNYLNESPKKSLMHDKKQFKAQLKPLTRNSINLFIQIEYLKHWVDYFGYDLPYFSFNTKLFGLEEQKEKSSEIDKDIIISVKGLFKNYNLGRTTVYALRGVDLEIKKGEFVAILGSSGVGKTTLLNCMAGLDTADHGKVFFKGKDLQSMSDSQKSEARLKDMGFIFQSYALLPHINTKENVSLPAILNGTSRKLRQRVEDLLEGVSINQQAKQFPAQLSGGQMQRVAIARALTNSPSVIFADEPTGDLDSTTGRQVMDLMKKFHEETGTTIVIITHEQEIANYAARQVTMEDGVIKDQ